MTTIELPGMGVTDFIPEFDPGKAPKGITGYQDPGIPGKNTPYYNKLDSNVYTPTGNYSNMVVATMKRDLLALKVYDTQGDFSWLGYVPASRYMYFRILLNNIMDKKKVSHADVEFCAGFYMPEDEKAKMIKFLRGQIDQQLQGFTVEIPNAAKPKSGLAPTAKGKRVIYYLNPGLPNLDLPVQLHQKIKNVFTEYEYGLITLAIHNLVLDSVKKALSSDYAKQGTEKQEGLDEMVSTFLSKALLMDKPSSLIDDYLDYFDPRFIKCLQKMAVDINNDRLTPKVITDLVNQIIAAKDKATDTYLNALLDPWNALNAKVPATIPFPTASFAMRSSVTLTTNASGNVAFAFVPHISSNITNSWTFVNNNAALTGSAAADFFLAVANEQSVPGGLYIFFRPVAAAVRMIPITSGDQNGGIMGVGLDMVDTGLGSAIGAVETNLNAYAYFYLVDNLYYSHTKAVSTAEPLSMKWLPRDSASAQQYWAYNLSGSTQPRIVGYVSGAEPSTSVVRLETIQLIEASVIVTMKDIIPATLPTRQRTPIESQLSRVDHYKLTNDLPKMGTDSLFTKFLNEKIADNEFMSSRINNDTVIHLPTNESKVSSYIKSHLSELGPSIYKQTISKYKNPDKYDEFSPYAQEESFY